MTRSPEVLEGFECTVLPIVMKFTKQRGYAYRASYKGAALMGGPYATEEEARKHALAAALNAGASR